MFKIIIAIAFMIYAFSIFGNTDQFNNSRYSFDSESYDRSNVNVKVVKFNNYQDLQSAAKKYGFEDPLSMMAFTTTDNISNECTIYIVDQKVKLDLDTLGHEFLHCLNGQWHSNED